jgi:plastocyanin
MKNIKILVIGVFILLLSAVVYLLISSMNSSEDTQPNTSVRSSEQSDTQNSESQNTTSSIITYTDNGFKPNKITVKEGTAITIKNSAASVLDFASDDHPNHLINSELNVGEIAPGQSKSFTVSKGEWGYHDHFDASNSGVIVVE